MFGLLDLSEMYTAHLLGFERQGKDNCDIVAEEARN